jgi:hypothetical protein
MKSSFSLRLLSRFLIFFYCSTVGEEGIFVLLSSDLDPSVLRKNIMAYLQE